jgi:hypothetical protein
MLAAKLIMALNNKKRARRIAPLCATCCALLALGFSACATAPPPDAAGPRANDSRPNEPPNMVLMTETEDRRNAAMTAWTKFTTEQGITNAHAPELQPVTATIRSLPAFTGTSLYLPKVGDAVPMSEENLREALRRFIVSASALIGAQPQHLSLIQRIDAADGTMRALYEQRPFRYPLRGGYGKLEISFTPDRKVLQITSTCIPEIEELRRAGAGTRPKWDAVTLSEQLATRTLTYSDPAGSTRTLSVAQGDEMVVRELVIYPVPRPGNPPVLEFHLAWEISVKHGTDTLTIYLDAVSDGIITTGQFPG